MAARKTPGEKKLELESKIMEANKKIAEMTKRAAEWQAKLEELERFEVHTLIKNLNMPVTEIKSLITEIASKKQASANQEHSQPP